MILLEERAWIDRFFYVLFLPVSDCVCLVSGFSYLAEHYILGATGVWFFLLSNANFCISRDILPRAPFNFFFFFLFSLSVSSFVFTFRFSLFFFFFFLLIFLAGDSFFN